MTMNNVYSKLRAKNIKNYLMLIFCTILSVVLVTSYAVMYLSPTVQSVLPTGGDSRKQANLIFGIAIIGCTLFTTYASSLFFKYKSRETGVLLSLGARKSQIKKVLFNELSLITFASSLIGLLLSIPVSFSIWKLFQSFVIDTKEMTYKVGWSGIIYGIAFCLFVTLCIFIMAAKFIKRTNIIDILNEHRKSEMVKDVKPWYGIVGVVLSVLGLVLGYGVTNLSLKYLHYRLPAIWNFTYVVSLIGIYMIMVYATVHTKKHKNPKRYYKNIIPKSMMKFIGKQTVKSMCITSFLIAGALFAIFYIPMVISGGFYTIDKNPYDYSFYYKMTENQIEKGEIYSLAKKYGVSINSYHEVSSISLIVNGVHEEWKDNGRIIYTKVNKIGYNEFFSESDFNKVSGQNVNVKTGEYLLITAIESDNSRYISEQQISKITNPITDITQQVKCAGAVTFKPFVKKMTRKYVISDEDYKEQSKKLTKANFERFILFNVANADKTYFFANNLKSEIIKRSSKNVAVGHSYDEYEKKLALAKGEKYYADNAKVELVTDNNRLYLEWKYYPEFGVLNRQDIIKNSAVFLMLFAYISIVCFTAIAIISYTRSVTIAINNKDLFNNLKKLGANNKYIKGCIKSQLKSIFVIPTIVGSSVIYLFYVMILYCNSGGSISESECIALRINLLINLIVALFMYIIYKLSLKKFNNILKEDILS